MDWVQIRKQPMKRILPAILLAGSLMSARATLFQYTVNFSSAGEALPSTATGSGTVNYDDVAHSLALSCNFSGLLGTTTASHIHAPTASAFTGNANVATTLPSFAGFPLGVSSGTFSSVLDLTQSSSWNPSFVSGNGGTTATAETAFAGFIASGKAYWNIHTTYATGGEIRAFLVAVPEPGMLSLALLGGIGFLARARKAAKA